MLTHAYGVAVNIPDLLRRAGAGDRDAISDLFVTLLHQGSVYPASYAAVPHLVASSLGPLPVEIRADLLILAGGIHAHSEPAACNALEEDVRAWYENAVAAALEPAVSLLSELKSGAQAIYVLEAAAAMRGHRCLGRVLSGFAEGEFAPTCPGCARQLYAWPVAGGLSVAAEDPVSHPDTQRMNVRENAMLESDRRDELRWLQETAARSQPLSDVRSSFPLLYGMAQCVACGRRFCLMDRLCEELA
jgi:hypothetical protein